MKKTKRFLGLLLILGMMSSFVAVAYAEENSTETAPSGLKVLSPAENDEYFNSLNQDEQEKIKEKIQSAENVAEELGSQARAATATKISIPGTFYIYQQTQSYYCSPAATKSIVQYLTGSSDSQGAIASALGTSIIGTDPTTIAPYLNSKQSKVHYIYNANPTQTTLLNNLYYDVVTMKSPSSVGISNSSGANWHYATSGHNLVVNLVSFIILEVFVIQAPL
ncbi:hypothetical protein [Paenibacillus sp. FSL R7-0179]|uniref:hypothetical protein n=1 Tax=Paenibacillus sp. FSL R7-0179 TaxID=2921672 RepID=UPI0030FB21B6